VSHPKTPGDLRAERAADREDDAERRDDTAHARDDAADRRDTDATGRDAYARRNDEDLAHRFERTCEQILDHLSRIENTTVCADDWPDVTPDVLIRLDAYTAEQRRLAGLDRAAVTALLDQLRDDLHQARQDRRAAAEDRRAAARDRVHAAGDRRDSGQDRSESARDRAQSTIEREQVGPGDLSADGRVDPPGRAADHRSLPMPPPTLAEQAIETSRQRISDSRDRINRARRATPPATDDAPCCNSED
jgi:hypothetical protein